ncbi:hypothetical protein TWF730_003576 [Orbilia blumenaviensis]|uniref:Uncharacterized protein n=1 Tax=Orbilia blumenaviensis TaxID=1796055 RepID=A0AAV9U6Q2_9PEZI
MYNASTSTRYNSPATVQSSIDVLIAVNLSSQSHLNYERNKEATKSFHRLYPLPAQHYPGKRCEYGDMVTMQYPVAFPKSVAKFVELSGNDVRYLLNFYGLTDLEDTIEVPPTTDFPDPFLFTSINDYKTAIGRHQCMEVLAKHIGLNFTTIGHESLTRLRNHFNEVSLTYVLDGRGCGSSQWIKPFKM